MVQKIEKKPSRVYKIGLTFNKLYAIFREKKKSSVFFANEFSKATALEGGRCDEESLTEWRGRMVHKAAVWYYEHLGGQKPIVIVTEDDKLLEQVISLIGTLNLASDLGHAFFRPIFSIKCICRNLEYAAGENVQKACIT